MSNGRIHCFCVATKAGEVIYERFYDRLSEIDKAEIRAAFQLASSNVRLNVDDNDFTGTFRSAHFAFIPYGDLVYYVLGSGEYDELAAADLIRHIASVLRELLGKQPSASVLLDKYTRLCLIIDEIINEGIIETWDKETIRKAMKLKAAWE